jgi:hypothetical protein
MILFYFGVGAEVEQRIKSFTTSIPCWRWGTNRPKEYLHVTHLLIAQSFVLRPLFMLISGSLEIYAGKTTLSKFFLVVSVVCIVIALMGVIRTLAIFSHAVKSIKPHVQLLFLKALVVVIGIQRLVTTGVVAGDLQ